MPPRNIMDSVTIEIRKRNLTQWLDQNNITTKAAVIFMIVFFTLLIVAIFACIILLLTHEPGIDPETGNVRIPWRTRVWSRMRYGRRVSSTVHPTSAVPGNSARPTPATNAGINPPGNGSLEEIDLARFSSRVETGVAHPMPMTPVSNPNASPTSNEEVQGPPFLTLRKVELSPRPSKAVPNTT
ncbi:hypothetical protein F5X98DRAFT_388447 [Xylaria grammica]|nr:hypothetical protein F5X98DRAFT_388447 [Xylaria grammica]